MGNSESTRRNEKSIRNEKYIKQSGEPVAFTTLHRTATASCQVIDNDGGKGSGFFARIKIQNIEKYGLFTNNRMLEEC